MESAVLKHILIMQQYWFVIGPNRDCLQLLGLLSGSFYWSYNHLPESPHGRYHLPHKYMLPESSSTNTSLTLLHSKSTSILRRDFITRIWLVVLCFRSMTLRRPTVCSMWPWEAALKATVLSFWPTMTSASTVCGKTIKMTDRIVLVCKSENDNGVGVVFRQVLLQHTVQLWGHDGDHSALRCGSCWRSWTAGGRTTISYRVNMRIQNGWIKGLGGKKIPIQFVWLVVGLFVHKIGMQFFLPKT